MKPIEFRRALAYLGWTLEGAGLRLGVLWRGKGNTARTAEYRSGARPVPPYIEEALKAHIALHDARQEIIRLTAEVSRLQDLVRALEAALPPPTDPSSLHDDPCAFRLSAYIRGVLD